MTLDQQLGTIGVGEKTRRDLLGAWDRHVEAFDGREIAALASPRPDGLRQLDPLAAMGLPVLARLSEQREKAA